MKSSYESIQNCDLFSGIGEADLSKLVSCLGGRVQTYSAGEFLILAGKSVPKLGVLASGSAQIIRENFSGGSMIVGTVETGDLFAETYACAGRETMPVSVLARESCEVLFLDVSRIVRPCGNACPFHAQLVANLLKILSEKNMTLNRKMSYLSHKTIRGRLEAYFYDRMEQSGSRDFTVPLRRGELAEYLGADRSALSRELSRMKEEGLLDFSGRNFHWHISLDTRKKS